MAGSGHGRLRAPSGTGDRRTGANERARLPDRYETIGLVARGGMASVWAARDRKLDRKVAIKLLSESYAGDEIAVRRFKREARAAARLSGHRNVVTIYDVGQRRPSEQAPFGRPYIVMEFLGGGTVADAIRQGGVTRAEAVQWLHGAAAALDHAHERGIVHRDVKPSNFLLDDHRVLHVADFGIASLGTEDTLTASGQLLGTAAYLAPERALGQPATAASDRYSLAVTAFELLAGARPFAGEEIAVLARQHIEAPPPRASALNPALPRAVDEPLERGMDKRPERRWPTAGAFADALDSALSRPARAPIVAPGPGSRWTRRRLMALAGVAACALLAGVAAAMSGGDRPRPAVAAAGSRAVARSPKPLTRAPATHTAPRPHPAAAASAPSSTAAATAPAGADVLESRGHALMEAGNYGAAIPVLRQAVAAASPGSLTYAYALYDLGRSLRLGGDPQAAIPILTRRLAIPNQTGVVRTELQLAMQAAGQGRSTAQNPAAAGPQPSGGGAPAPSGRPGHGHHGHPDSGGAAFSQNQGD